MQIARPSEAVADAVHHVVNNITEANIDDQTSKLRARLVPECFPWFAHYLVTTRVAPQPNYQLGTVANACSTSLGGVRACTPFFLWRPSSVFSFCVSFWSSLGSSLFDSVPWHAGPSRVPCAG